MPEQPLCRVTWPMRSATYYAVSEDAGVRWTSKKARASAFTQSEAVAIADRVGGTTLPISESPKMPQYAKIRQHKFLLVQDNHVIDVCPYPQMLMFNFIDPHDGFKVAIGHINEFGQREVVGIVAEAGYLRDAESWLLTSPQDGYNRVISTALSPTTIVSRRLQTLWENLEFDDLCDLPLPVTLLPGKKAQAPSIGETQASVNFDYTD